MIGPVLRTDVATSQALGKGFRALPPKVQLALLALAVLAGMAGCSAAWVDQQDYQPSPQVCRADEGTRTDCIHVRRESPQVQTPNGWDR